MDKKRCITCKNWIGDKKAARKLLKEKPEGLDEQDFFTEFGVCKKYRTFTFIVNDCRKCHPYVEIAASFGCIMHEQDK